MPHHCYHCEISMLQFLCSYSLKSPQECAYLKFVTHFFPSICLAPWDKKKKKINTSSLPVKIRLNH